MKSHAAFSANALLPKYVFSAFNDCSKVIGFQWLSVKTPLADGSPTIEAKDDVSTTCFTEGPHFKTDSNNRRLPSIAG